MIPMAMLVITRGSIIFSRSQDLEVKTMKETSVRWKPTADMAELEATTATTQVLEIDALSR